MKGITFVLLCLVVMSLSLVSITASLINSGKLGTNSSFFQVAGLTREGSKTQFSISRINSTDLSTNIGSEASKDNFQVVLVDNNFDYNELQEHELNYGTQEIVVDSDMIYTNSFTEQPLVAQDYYWGKYENGKAGVNGLNKMPILRPGDNVGVIRDMYINVRSGYGFIQPARGYYFGSGLCWSTSAMGAMMDQANRDFNAKYGVDLFTFRYGDRAPHSSYYRTYQNANNGYGYTVAQRSPGNPIQDYRFTINPDLKNIPELADIKIKIVMIATESHESATYGQSIGGYILSNKEF